MLKDIIQHKRVYHKPSKRIFYSPQVVLGGDYDETIMVIGHEDEFVDTQDCIVMYWTGSTDYKNKKIYEDDVLYDAGLDEYYLARFNDNSFEVGSPYSVVVGNIHENPIIAKRVKHYINEQV